MSLLRRLVSFCSIIVIAGCGGGGASGPGPATGSTQVTTGQLPITFTFSRGAQSQLRQPRFVSPATQSFGIYVSASTGTPPTTPSSTLNVSSCTGTTTLTCSTQVPAPLGADVVTIKAFTAANAGGTIIATVTTNVTVTPGMAAVSFTLQGTPAVVALSLETPMLVNGTAGTSKLDVNAYDASGNLIIAPGNFANPVTITSDSTSVTLSGTTATAPGTQLTVTYAGGAAPYAVHFKGTSTGVATTSIIGATLVIAPASSFVVLGINQSFTSDQLTQVATSAGALEPPQSQIPIALLAGTAPGAAAGFAYTSSGAVGLSNFNFTTMQCMLGTYAPTTYTQNVITYPPGDGVSGACPLTAEPSGDILAGQGTNTSQLAEFSINGSGAATATGRVISLVGSQVPGASVVPEQLATNASGQIALLAQNGATFYVLVYASGASGAATPLHTFTPSGTGTPEAIAIANDGTVAVAYFSVSNYTINVYTSAGSLAGTYSPSLPSGYSYDNSRGLAFDASDDIFSLDILSYYGTPSNFASNVYLYQVGAYGSGAPTLTSQLSLAAGTLNALAGPVMVSQTPTVVTAPSPVSGDMMAYAPSRTWTYAVNVNGTTGYFGLYADPNLVNGNVRLVGYQSATANPFSTSNEIASGDFTNVNGSYYAAAFASVSSGVAGTSGTVPGTPLFVPNALALNSTFNPLQNATIAALSGVYAQGQVVAVGTVPGISACPAGSSTSGATVQYTIGQAALGYAETLLVSYVPGCGITAIQGDGGTATLQSVGTASLGQQAVPSGQPANVQFLHALWRTMFGQKPPH